MGSAGFWQWIWLAAAVLFAVAGAGTTRSVWPAPLAIASGLAFVVMMFGFSATTAAIVFFVTAVIGAGSMLAAASRLPAPDAEPRSGERRP